VITEDVVRAAARSLPATSERVDGRGGRVQFVTNGKCFAELAPADGDAVAGLRVWGDGGWSSIALAALADRAALDGRLLRAWRQRAKRMDVAGYDYARGREDLAEVFAELRSWPELTERGVGDFGAGGRAFLHFHHSETSRHADVKQGLGWGDPIPFPLGRPSAKVTKAFYAEVRRRLAITLDEVAAAKRSRSPRASRSEAPTRG
jgi:hypothetical protein